MIGTQEESQRVINVGLLLYTGCQIAMIYGMTDLLEVASRFSKDRGGPIFIVKKWSKGDDGSIISSFVVERPEEARPDIVVVPGRVTGPATQMEALPFIDWIKTQYGQGTVLASSCAGAFILAETGLLSGRTVTMHWVDVEAFRSRFPTVELAPDRITIEEGDLITAGGLMAWTDLGLRIVNRFLGPTIMLETAKFFLVDPAGREQRHYSSFMPRLTHGDSAILKVQQWLQKGDSLETALPDLAARANLESRTFTRRFKSATGLTPAEYVRQLRISKARELLQFTRHSVDQIAWAVGYQDTSAFARAFVNLIGISPREYRRRFSAEDKM
ncbi:GlxA family transcriptional regulator [Acidisoma silvae]|uniref:GlxA family transcriptional regulator n=1 Tax=Acidisoma silvae TaxID=2802396 RepID=A0A964E149_9PROT|nr:GlxA family transcriptional regulator [Acidisoma silvae]MCB8877847.1 GlxA family transcriptional regulator [Acidisoma silvae]